MAKTLYGKRASELKHAVVFGTVFSVLLSIFLFIIVANGFFLLRIEVNKTSMYPTLKDKDIVYANRYRKVNYGDIVIISGEESAWIVKRVIGMGGDSVKIEGGYVYLKKAGEEEFTKLEEKYLAKQGVTPCKLNCSLDVPETYEVGENEIFYLGDNRTVSKDSRSEFKNCNKSQIVGVVTEWSVKFKGFNTAVYNFTENLSKGISRIFGA